MEHCKFFFILSVIVTTATAISLSSLPTIPDVNSLIPAGLPSAANASSVFIPHIPELPSVSALPKIPGLSEAIQAARDHAASTLDIGNNLIDGIQTAVEQAFQSHDPSGALRTLVNTILDTYVGVAQNCPMIVIGIRVLQEGIRLAGEVSTAARNIILGPSP